MRRLVWCVGVWLACVVAGVTASAQSSPQPTPVPQFRLFLVDGTEVVVHGEPARLDDQVIATVPVGAVDADAPQLQAVSLPQAAVNWTRTDAYSAAVRLARYTASSAERDYAAFTDDIAQTLGRVSSTPDPLERIALVTRARDRLSAWPREHYGYRQRDAEAMLTVLDDVLAGLRAAAGQQHFTLTLASGVAAASAPPRLRPVPSTQDLALQALTLSRHVADPAERTALLDHALRLVGEATGAPRGWARDVRRDIRRQLEAERKVARAYGALRVQVLERAQASLERADVKALLALREEVSTRDRKLGARRPAAMHALLAHLEWQLEEARRWRLVLDRWQERQPVVSKYVASVGELLGGVGSVRQALEDIRTLAGPSLSDLDKADALLAGMRVQTERLDVPAEAMDVHALISSVLQMTGRAIQTRRRATQEGSLARAWEASAAAAGALMTLDRTRSDLADLDAPPRRAAAAQSPPR